MEMWLCLSRKGKEKTPMTLRVSLVAREGETDHE